MRANEEKKAFENSSSGLRSILFVALVASIAFNIDDSTKSVRGVLWFRFEINQDSVFYEGNDERRGNLTIG